MKTANRASRKAGKKSTSAQSANIPKNSPGKIPAPVRVGTFKEPVPGQITAGLELSRDVFCCLFAHAVSKGKTLECYLEELLFNEYEKAADAAPAVPVMCEEGLDERAQKWNADKRRRMALLFDRWAAQLRLSAEVMDKAGMNLGEPCELVFPDQELQEQITGLSPAQCVALITKFEGWCEQICISLGLDKTKSIADKAQRSLMVWQS